MSTDTEHINNVKNGTSTYKSIDIGETTVKDFGTTAILVGKGTFKIGMNGQGMTYKMAFIDVYLKKTIVGSLFQDYQRRIKN